MLHPNKGMANSNTRPPQQHVTERRLMLVSCAFNPSTCPGDRTFRTFGRWFEFSFHSVSFDLCDDPLKRRNMKSARLKSPAIASTTIQFLDVTGGFRRDYLHHVAQRIVLRGAHHVAQPGANSAIFLQGNVATIYP
jgi:hypothetical protein